MVLIPNRIRNFHIFARQHNNMDKQQIFKDALEKWGWQAQMDMVHEECLELASAIHKLRRAHTPEDLEEKMANVYDEAADIIIMSEQLPLLLDMNKVQERINFKLERLSGKLYKNTTS